MFNAPILNDFILGPKKGPKPKWCKHCGRKHPAREKCDLELIKDLTVAEGRKVGHYKVRTANEHSKD